MPAKYYLRSIFQFVIFTFNQYQHIDVNRIINITEIVNNNE